MINNEMRRNGPGKVELFKNMKVYIDEARFVINLKFTNNGCWKKFIHELFVEMYGEQNSCPQRELVARSEYTLWYIMLFSDL